MLNVLLIVSYICFSHAMHTLIQSRQAKQPHDQAKKDTSCRASVMWLQAHVVPNAYVKYGARYS